MPNLVSALPSIIATASFSVLLLAFVHEWAFFLIVGSRFQTLLIPSDYFSSAVTWLPLVTVGARISMLGGIIESRGFGYSNEIKTAYYALHPRRWIVAEGPYVAIPIICAAGAVLQLLFFRGWYSFEFVGAAIILFCYGWWKLVLYLFEHQNAPFVNQRGVWVAISMAGPLLGIAFGTGVLDGISILSAKETVLYGRVTNDSSEHPWILVRSLSTGVLVREIGGQRLQFLRWPEVVSLQAPVPTLNQTGLLCRFFGKSCVLPQ